MESPLEQLAKAGIEPEDLADGVIGKCCLTSDYPLTRGEASKLVDSIRDGQRTFRSAGWRPRPDLSHGRFRDGRIEYAVYERDGLWATISVARFLGIQADFAVSKREPY